MSSIRVQQFKTNTFPWWKSDKMQGLSQIWFLMGVEMKEAKNRDWDDKKKRWNNHTHKALICGFLAALSLNTLFSSAVPTRPGRWFRLGPQFVEILILFEEHVLFGLRQRQTFRRVNWEPNKFKINWNKKLIKLTYQRSSGTSAGAQCPVIACIPAKF